MQKPLIDVENEMVRLNTNLLQPVPQVLCDSTSVSHLTIALLNVRSIVSKLSDIKADNSRSILCFCETWLNASQPSRTLLHDQIDIRCDRTCENKSGVIICVPSEMCPSNTHRFATNGIEAVSATLELPNINNLQIAVVYRSSSVSQTALITVLSRLLTHVSLCNTACVILGDFNEDILHRQNCALLSLMSSFGFKQLVKLLTTAQGTLIDHVYYKNQSSSIIVQVQDTYYSDHDTVYCSIPFSY